MPSFTVTWPYITRLTGRIARMLTELPVKATFPSAQCVEPEEKKQQVGGEHCIMMSALTIRPDGSEAVQFNIRRVLDIVTNADCIINVILVNACLSDKQKVAAWQIAERAGTEYPKDLDGIRVVGDCRGRCPANAPKGRAVDGLYQGAR